MTKTISQKALDEVIRLTRKYHKTGDGDICDSLIGASHQASISLCGNDSKWLPIEDLIGGMLGGMNSLKPYATNKDVYDVFTMLGYEVKDDAGSVTNA